jgi:hypothetical protein
MKFDTFLFQCSPRVFKVTMRSRQVGNRATLRDACFALRGKLIPRAGRVHRESKERRNGSVTHISGNLPKVQALATSAAGSAAPPAPNTVQQPVVYDGVIFDMDGTLIVSVIDYMTMRERTGIPSGDLFTV